MWNNTELLKSSPKEVRNQFKNCNRMQQLQCKILRFDTFCFFVVLKDIVALENMYIPNGFEKFNFRFLDIELTSNPFIVALKVKVGYMISTWIEILDCTLSLDLWFYFKILIPTNE